MTPLFFDTKGANEKWNRKRFRKRNADAPAGARDATFWKKSPKNFSLGL